MSLLSMPCTPRAGIAIVNAQPSIIEVLTAVLDDLGYDVLQFLDVAIALDQIHFVHPSAVIVDAFALNDTGQDILDSLKSESRTMAIPCSSAPIPTV